MLKMGLIAVAASSIISIGTVAVDHLFFEAKQQDIVSVDLQQILADEIQANAKVGVTEAQREERAKRFGQALESALSQAGKHGDKLVLVAPAVLRGAEDATAYVQSAIKADLERLQQ